MSDLDGVYRHLGVTLSWNAQGLTLLRPGGHAERLSWLDVQEARECPGEAAGRPAELQILVRPRRAGGALETVDVAVASRGDAGRLLEAINSSAVAAPAGETPGCEGG